eukprot:5630860-Pleurochrysis_carterae.AAC.1
MCSRVPHFQSHRLRRAFAVITASADYTTVFTSTVAASITVPAASTADAALTAFAASYHLLTVCAPSAFTVSFAALSSQLTATFSTLIAFAISTTAIPLLPCMPPTPSLPRRDVCMHAFLAHYPLASRLCSA